MYIRNTNNKNMEKTMNLQERISAIIAEMGAIKKKVEKGGPNFAFRSIDDVVNTANPLFSKYNVTIQSEVVSHTLNHRNYKNKFNEDKFAFYATVVLRMKFCHGQEMEIWEEVAMSEDNSDKALTQAMSMAFKYGLIRKLMIVTEELSKSDADKKPSEDDKPAPKPDPKPDALIALEKGSDNWNKVVKALEGSVGTIEQVKKKYTLSAELEKELTDLVGKVHAERIKGK